MLILKLLGMWRDYGEAWVLPHPRLVAEPSTWSPERRASVCGYLTSGVEVISELGFSHCRFDCGIADRAMGCREFSDGFWAWPEGLLHYVDVHGVVLPEPFADDAVAARDFDRGFLDEPFNFHTSYWLNWIELKRSAMSFRERLARGGFRDVLASRQRRARRFRDVT